MTGKFKPLAHAWKPGQSGNPKGRPKGITTKALIKQEIEAKVEQMGINVEAGALLRDRGKEVILEVLRIALQPDDEAMKTRTVDGEKVRVIVRRPSEAKVKCLIACLERIVPALKTVSLTESGHRSPGDLSDDEIVALMQKMVAMAQSGGNNPGGDPQIH
jgi:hypothetical protein